MSTIENKDMGSWRHKLEMNETFNERYIYIRVSHKDSKLAILALLPIYILQFSSLFAPYGVS